MVLDDLFVGSHSFLKLFGNGLFFAMLFLSAFVLFAIAWISTRVSNQIRPIRVYLFRAHEEEIESEPELVDSVSQSPISQENEPHDNEDEVVFTESENSEANEDEDELRDYLTTRKQSPAMDDENSGNRGNAGHIVDKKSITEREEARAAKHRSRGHIVIRLQYLDDRSRFVHAAPEMPITHFKRKYFRNEMLNQQKNVRLIFQGRELTDRDQRRSSLTRGPLRRLCDYSVTDNATIHCLVTNRPSSSIVSASTDDSTQIRRRRNPGGSFYSYIQSSTVSAAATFFDRSNSTQLNDSGNSGARQPVSGTPNRFISTANALLEHIFSDLDLSNRMLLICFTGILCISWLFHLTHRHYYNHYSTITLLGVTASFVLGFFLQLPPGEIAFTAQVIPRLHIRQSREPSAPEAPLSSSQSIAHTLSERVPSSSSHQVLETATIQAAESGLQNTIFSAEPSQATSSISQPLAEAPVEDLVSSAIQATNDAPMD